LKRTKKAVLGRRDRCWKKSTDDIPSKSFSFFVTFRSRTMNMLSLQLAPLNVRQSKTSSQLITICFSSIKPT